MSDISPNVVPMPKAHALDEETIHNARKNDYGKTFTLGGRTFELKDLEYDDYVQFIKLSSPLVEAVVSVIQPVLKPGDNGQMVSDFELDLRGLDLGVLADLAGHNLPIMAHLACRQSDPTITIDQVKRLSMSRENSVRGPLAMIEVVLKQVAHNRLVEEFAAAFPRLGSLVNDLAPGLATALATPTQSSTTRT